MPDYAIEAFISWCDDMTISQESTNGDEGFFAKCKRVIKSCIDRVIKWFKSIPDKLRNAKNRMKDIIDKIRANFNKVDKAKSNDEAAKIVEDAQKSVKDAENILKNIQENNRRHDEELKKLEKNVKSIQEISKKLKEENNQYVKQAKKQQANHEMLGNMNAMMDSKLKDLYDSI